MTDEHEIIVLLRCIGVSVRYRMNTAGLADYDVFAQYADDVYDKLLAQTVHMCTGQKVPYQVVTHGIIREFIITVYNQASYRDIKVITDICAPMFDELSRMCSQYYLTSVKTINRKYDFNDVESLFLHKFKIAASQTPSGNWRWG